LQTFLFQIRFKRPA